MKQQLETNRDLGTYPECISSNNFYRKFKGTGFKEFDDFKKAVRFLKKHRDWQIYTEIEGETRTLYYDRGFHICNRTGYYAIVKDPRFQVAKYTGLD